jgi:Domain of unknown function (DUF6457)
VLENWITALAEELDIQLTVDVDALLALARDAAHHVARPAAPVTTFLIGYAAASQGGSADVAQLCRRASELALTWDTDGQEPN